MKQLEIKHLAPYLPYGLKGIAKDNSNNGSIECAIGWQGSELITDFDNIEIDMFIPILYPLGYLTKEITHNGETFVPIEWLFEKYYPTNKSQTYYYDTQTNYIRCSHINTPYHKRIWIASDSVGRNSFEDIQQLIEWRFDVFNLINDGLAIPVTETFNPYKQ